MDNKKRRNLLSITDEEIDDVFRITGIEKSDFKISAIFLNHPEDSKYKGELSKKTKNIYASIQNTRSIVLENEYFGDLMISEKDVSIRPKNNSEFKTVQNILPLAQYLIDRGFNFDYEEKLKN